MLSKPHNTLVTDYQHVVEIDPCFDTAAEGWKEAWSQFLTTGDWSALPRTGTGEPTVFVLRHLTGRARVKVESLFSQARTRADALYVAAQYAMVSVTNLFLGDSAVTIAHDRDPENGCVWVSEGQMALLYEKFPQAIVSIAERTLGRMNADPS